MHTEPAFVGSGPGQMSRQFSTPSRQFFERRFLTTLHGCISVRDRRPPLTAGAGGAATATFFFAFFFGGICSSRTTFVHNDQFKKRQLKCFYSHLTALEDPCTLRSRSPQICLQAVEERDGIEGCKRGALEGCGSGKEGDVGKGWGRGGGGERWGAVVSGGERWGAVGEAVGSSGEWYGVGVVGSDEERWGEVGWSGGGEEKGMGRGEGGHKNNFNSSSTEQNKKNLTSDAEKRNFSLSSSK